MNKDTPSPEFARVFGRLRDVLRPYAKYLVCTQNTAVDYYLNTHHIMKNKKPLFFAAAQIKKNYVSYHLMPIYVFPELITDLSPSLRQRMQGKSCFNFRAVNPPLMLELETLTTAGMAKYRQAGYVNV